MILYQVVKWLESYSQLKAFVQDINRVLPEWVDRHKLWETLILQACCEPGFSFRMPETPEDRLAEATPNRTLDGWAAAGSRIGGGEAVPQLPPNLPLPDLSGLPDLTGSPAAEADQAEYVGLAARKIYEFFFIRTVVNPPLTKPLPAVADTETARLTHDADAEPEEAFGDGPVWLAAIRGRGAAEAQPFADGP